MLELQSDDLLDLSNAGMSSEWKQFYPEWSCLWGVTVDGLSARRGQSGDDNGSRVLNVFISILRPAASEISLNRRDLNSLLLCLQQR